MVDKIRDMWYLYISATWRPIIQTMHRLTLSQMFTKCNFQQMSISVLSDCLLVILIARPGWLVFEWVLWCVSVLFTSDAHCTLMSTVNLDQWRYATMMCQHRLSIHALSILVHFWSVPHTEFTHWLGVITWLASNNHFLEIFAKYRVVVLLCLS